MPLQEPQQIPHEPRSSISEAAVNGIGAETKAEAPELPVLGDDVVEGDSRVVKRADIKERVIPVHVEEGQFVSSDDSPEYCDLNGVPRKQVGTSGSDRAMAGKHQPSTGHANTAGGSRQAEGIVASHDIEGGLHCETFANSASTSSSGSEKSSDSIRAKRHGVPPVVASLTDDQRMNLLRHVKPSVFGTPVRLHTAITADSNNDGDNDDNDNSGKKNDRNDNSSGGGGNSNTSNNKTVAAKSRPRSAADAMGTRPPKGFAASGVSSLDSDVEDRRQLYSRQSRACASNIERRQDWGKVCKRKGVLVQDNGWIGGGNDKKSPRLSVSTPQTSLTSILNKNRDRSGTTGECDRRGDRAQSFVNSTAFEVNMGILESLAGPSVSAVAASCFLSRPAVVGKRRGQSAPRARR